MWCGQGLRLPWTTVAMKEKVKYFRWRDQQILSALACVAGATYFVVAGFSSIEENPGFAFFEFTVGLGWTVLAMRSWRAGAVSSRSGLVVRNIFRTVFLPWSQIAGFTVGTMRIVRRPVVVAELVNGGVIALGTFTAPAPTAPAMRRINRMVDRLNSEKSRLT